MHADHLSHAWASRWVPPRVTRHAESVVRELLQQHGRTYADAAARESFSAGWRTPERMRAATWQQRVDALGWASWSTPLSRPPASGRWERRIFCREVQDVWPVVAPFFVDRALSDARWLGLPDDPDELAALAPGREVARLTAALVRSDLAR